MASYFDLVGINVKYCTSGRSALGVLVESAVREADENRVST